MTSLILNEVRVMREIAFAVRAANYTKARFVPAFEFAGHLLYHITLPLSSGAACCRYRLTPHATSHHCLPPVHSLPGSVRPGFRFVSAVPSASIQRASG